MKSVVGLGLKQMGDNYVSDMGTSNMASTQAQDLTFELEYQV